MSLGITCQARNRVEKRVWGGGKGALPVLTLDIAAGPAYDFELFWQPS